MAIVNSGPLIMGRSWVSFLESFGLWTSDFSHSDVRGGTFSKFAKVLEIVPVIKIAILWLK